LKIKVKIKIPNVPMTSKKDEDEIAKVKMDPD
jgi:hypothetical protein